MIVLVCGGRDYHDVDAVRRTLDILHHRDAISLLVHGGASGADFLAGRWAAGKAVPALVYEAEWQKHGRAAGPIRNQRMIDDARPDLAVAFPGGRGTEDMVRRCDTAGVKVVRVGQREAKKEQEP